MSRIWLISMTVGNAGYPAKCTLSRKKIETNRESKGKNKIKTRT